MQRLFHNYIYCLLSFITHFINGTDRLSYFISINEKSFLFANKTIFFVTCTCTFFFHTTRHTLTLCNFNYYSQRFRFVFGRVHTLNNFCLKLIKCGGFFLFPFKQISCISCLNIWFRKFFVII